ncbi:MAG: alpha/beta hydrolase [Deltaproteobacteria bacterium]
MTEDRSILTRAATPPDEIIAYGAEPEHIADVRHGGERAKRRPLVVLIHGGFWRPAFDRAHAGPMAAALAGAGWTVASVEYRRAPPVPDHTTDDIGWALESLPANIPGHDGRVLVMGHSAGGHLALWAASRRPVPRLHAALALAPVADLQLAHALKLGGGAVLAFLSVEPEERADLDPRWMPPPAIPTTIVHGEADEVVPLSVSESYVAAHPEVRLVKLRAAGHFALIDPLSEAWPAVVAELERLGA